MARVLAPVTTAPTVSFCQPGNGLVNYLKGEDILQEFSVTISKLKRKSACKPGSVVDNHSSGMHVAVHLKRPTREQRGPRQCSPIWSCSGWGLPCHGCYQPRGALLPHHFTLTGAEALRRYIFCGTFRRLTPPRRYLAPCPVEPGLSSVCKACSDCLADSRGFILLIN